MANGVNVGFRLKEFFSVKKGALLNIAVLLVALHYLIWDVAGLGGYVRKQLFGAQREEGTFLGNIEIIEDFEDYNAGGQVNLKGYLVRKTFKKKYSVSGTFVSKKSNVDFLQYSPIKLTKEEKDAYMVISPNSLTVLWGPRIYNALRQCDFVLATKSYVNCPKEYKEEDAHINNYHIIPATKSIENGIKALSKLAKKEIYLEGLLIDWDFVTDKNEDDLRFKTALNSGELMNHDRSEDVKLRKNFQLYLTRMIYDGYEFK